jgi:hypothetical protein
VSLHENGAQIGILKRYGHFVAPLGRSFACFQKLVDAAISAAWFLGEREGSER